MGQIHNAIHSGPLSKALKLLLGDSRGGEGLERYGETLQPVIDLWERIEFALPRDEEWFGGFGAVAAGGAGTFGKVGVFNPTSNLIVVVLRHWLSVDVGARVGLFPVGTVLGNTQTVVMLDRRRVVNHGAVIHFEASAAAGADQCGSFNIPTLLTTHTLLNYPWVLPPGRGFMFRNEDDNANLVYCCIGYQRKALSGELL